jgi:hypothetical protein
MYCSRRQGKGEYDDSPNLFLYLASFGHGGWLKVENEQGALMEAVRVEIDHSPV